ncbi:uncharacterized protein HaLaN_00937, partial [Haematococcus lacustris]
MHTLMRGVSAAGLEAGAVVPSEVVEARLYDQLVLWVEACSKRALLASLLLGLMVRDSFTRVTVLADGQELLEEIPAVDADIPDFAERNLFLQLGRGLPPPGIHSRPSAAVEDVLTAYPDLHAKLDEVPRYPQDSNTVDDVGQKLETSFANSLTELCSCKAHHIKLDTKAIYGLMRAAGMLPADITSLTTFRNGVAGPRDSEVANRWIAFLPDPSIWPNDGQTFAQVVHTDGVTVSVLFKRPKPAGPPDELPRMGKQEGAVNPLAYLEADWLGCDPGKTNMATVAHEERHPSGAVESVWQRSLSAGQYYRQSGITQHAKTSKAWMASIQPEHDVLSQVTNYTASLQRYREYVAMTLVTWPAMWAELSKPRWSNARFRLYGGKQRTVAKEACQQFPGRVLLVDEFRTSRVSSARTNVVAGHAEAFRWLRPVRSTATRSRIRGLMCSTSIGIRFYDRD